jgi:hypothetical protein
MKAGSVCSGARRVWRRGGARLGAVGLQQLAAAVNVPMQARKEKKGTLLRVTSQVGRWAVGRWAAEPPSDRGRLQGEREPGRYKASGAGERRRERDIELARQPGR